MEDNPKTEAVQLEIPGIPLAKVPTTQIRLGYLERAISTTSETIRFKLQARESVYSDDKYLGELREQLTAALAELQAQ